MGALQRAGLAIFVHGEGISIGRLTDAGIKVRDKWARLDANRLWQEQRKSPHPELGLRRRHRERDGEG